jgi:hypothetical protein
MHAIVGRQPASQAAIEFKETLLAGASIVTDNGPEMLKVLERYTMGEGKSNPVQRARCGHAGLYKNCQASRYGEKL